MENQFPKSNGSANLHYRFEVTLPSRFLLTTLLSRLSYLKVTLPRFILKFYTNLSQSNPTTQVPSHNPTIQAFILW